MKRTGRVIFFIILLLGCMMGLWLFQSWKDSRPGEKEILYNAYITGAEGSYLTAVSGSRDEETVSGAAIKYLCASELKESVNGIADLYLEKGKVVKIVKKADSVEGTIQKIEETSVTLDEYGEVMLDERFAVYKQGSDGMVQKIKKEDLFVGQKNVKFTAAGNKVCAAFFLETVTDTIRVLLQDSTYSSYDHDIVELISDADMVIEEGEKTGIAKKGSEIQFEPESVSGTIRIHANNKGKIKILSLERNGRTPEYRGTLLLVKKDKSLHIINELPLEEYLYGVVPSEMPAEYEKEALKAQAVCARSYAVEQMRKKRLASFGAHVDDGLSFQMYNSQKEEEASTKAVQETKGKVITYKDKIASTYFYSCSCGSSAGTEEVWLTPNKVSYLPSVNRINGSDLSNENVFEKFICRGDLTDAAGESKSSWYRWSTKIDTSALKFQKTFNEKLKKRFAINPNQILKKQEDGSFKSEAIEDFGEIENIVIKKRGKSGVVMEAEIEGSEETVRVYTEYNIRTLLGDTSLSYLRADNSKVNGVAILPSGYFTLKKEKEGFVLHGGGYGHGVGMSQEGADAMASGGKNINQIISFYYPGTEIKDLESVG